MSPQTVVQLPGVENRDRVKERLDGSTQMEEKSNNAVIKGEVNETSTERHNTIRGVILEGDECAFQRNVHFVEGETSI